jgi:hypothetical protein
MSCISWIKKWFTLAITTWKGVRLSLLHKVSCKSMTTNHDSFAGGFLVIRPSLERFEEFRAIIRKGDHSGRGWGGSRIGNFWGGQTIQGIVPYFYHVVHPGDGMEVNRCVYNCMVDNPYFAETTRCLDGEKTCEDCRLQRPELVKSAHFTICQKPWTCTEHTNPRNMVFTSFPYKWYKKVIVLGSLREAARNVVLTERWVRARNWCWHFLSTAGEVEVQELARNVQTVWRQRLSSDPTCTNEIIMTLTNVSPCVLMKYTVHAVIDIMT